MNEIEVLKKSFEKNSEYAGWSGQAVVVGLALDIIILLAFASDKQWVETAASIFATLVIAGGVWSELHFGHKGNAAAKRLQQISDEKIAETYERAAEANRVAEQERHARVKIEERLAPRLIEPERIDQMVEALKPFAGMEFTASVAKDAEAFSLLFTLLHAFRRAGLVFRPYDSLPRLDTGVGFVGVSEITTGVIFHVPPSIQGTAVAMLTAFRFSGLKPPPMITVGSENRLKGRVHIEVGKKDVTK